MENLITNLNEQLRSMDSKERFILGIDGLSRSGKTTLVNKLHKVMDTPTRTIHTFHLDDYIVERKQRYHTGFDEWYEYYQLQWDVDWLRRHFFAQLKSTDELCLPLYNGETDSHRHEKILLSETDIIIVEGVFLQRKEWREFFDYIVYLDCSRIERFQRESDDTRKKWRKFQDRYWKAEEYYENTESPKETADLVLRG